MALLFVKHYSQELLVFIFSRLKTPSRGLTKPEFLSDMHELVTKGETLSLLWGPDKSNQTVMGEGSVLLARDLVQVLKTDQ